jgi:thymidylate synthase (FAD)
MKVELVNFTPHPVETAFWAFKNMHNDIPTKVEGMTQEQKEKFIDVIAKIPHQTVLEYINTVWYISASRAFQQQLTRNRDAAYSIQSLRIVNVGAFADSLDYHCPAGTDRAKYHKHMLQAQNSYNEILKSTGSVEAARGVLPLNINSPITMTINMRSLVHMLDLRLCSNTQEEFRRVARAMKKEISKKIDPYFANVLLAPACEKIGYCNSTHPCTLVPDVYENRIPHSPKEVGLV